MDSRQFTPRAKRDEQDYYQNQRFQNAERKNVMREINPEIVQNIARKIDFSSYMPQAQRGACMFR